MRALALSEAPAAEIPAPSLWRNRDYLSLWFGQTVSMAGTAVTSIAFPLLVLAVTRSAALAGLVGACEKLPYLVLGLPAGALVDRWDRKRTMICCDIGRALSLGSIPLAYWLAQLTAVQLCVVALIDGILFVFFSVAEGAALPRVVPEDQLARAAGQIEASGYTGELVGVSLAGVLFGSVGRAIPFLFDALSYAVSVVTLSTIKTPFQETRAVTDHHLGDEILAGLRFLRRNRPLRVLAGLSFGFNMVLAGELLIIILLAQRVFHASPHVIGFMVGFASVGGIAGGLLAGRVAAQLGHRQIIAGWGWAIAALWLAASFAPTIALLTLTLGALTLIAPWYWVTQYSYRVTLVPDELQGRVNSVFRMIAFGGQPLGLALAGLSLQCFGPRPTIRLVVAALIVLATIAGLSVRPSRRARTSFLGASPVGD